MPTGSFLTDLDCGVLRLQNPFFYAMILNNMYIELYTKLICILLSLVLLLLMLILGIP